MIVGDKLLGGNSLYTDVIDSTAPLAGWFAAITNWIFGDSLIGRHILAFMILFVEAVLLGIIFIDKKAFPDSSFIPSLIFGILCAFSFNSLELSGELAGTVFLLLALNSLFKEIEFREETYEMVLRTGIFLGIASLFEFSFSVYVLASLIIMILYTRTSGRKILLLIVAYALPHLLLMSIYYIKGGAGDVWQFFYVPNLAFTHDRLVAHGHLLTLMAIPAFFFIASLVILNRESRFTKYQSQLLQAMFFWTIFSIVQVYYSKTLRPASFIPVMIGFAFYTSHFFLIIMRRRFAELSFWLFVAGIVAFALYSRYRQSGTEMYARLFVPASGTAPVSGKRIVVLSDSVALYRDNVMATPFLNWHLSERIFSEPEYYDNITRVHEGFADRPDVVIDPANRLKPFLDNIPELRKEYTRSGNTYVRVASP